MGSWILVFHTYLKEAKNDVQTALLYNNSEILTFDGKLYQMEGKYYENLSISINFKMCYIEIFRNFTGTPKKQ
jgi:hypothetical protein